MAVASILPDLSLLGVTSVQGPNACVPALAGWARPKVLPATAARLSAPPVSTARRALLGGVCPWSSASWFAILRAGTESLLDEIPQLAAGAHASGMGFPAKWVECR